MNDHSNEQEARTTSEADPLEALAGIRRTAPPGFVDRVMSRLPDGTPRRGWGLFLHHLWPDDGRWLAPALAGACAALLLSVTATLLLRPATSASVVVHFALHAPGAQTVELLGDFTGWENGRIRLRGPDGSGHWTADVELPAGRHEYIFLVDGRQWITDPQADIRRPDGFGRENAVMDL